MTAPAPPITHAEAKAIYAAQGLSVSESHLDELVHLANFIAAGHGECPRDVMQEWAQNELESQSPTPPEEHIDALWAMAETVGEAA